MEVLTATTQFVEYVSEIKKATFGTEDKPLGVEQQAVNLITKSARSQESHNNLDQIIRSSNANHDKITASTTYNKQGKLAEEIAEGISIMV